jgi:hypothetical protein
MRTVSAHLVLLLSCVVFVAAADARDIYVDNLAGDDTFTGTEPQVTQNRTGPVRTIAKALRLASQGDHIVLENTGVPYRESVSLVGSRHSGYSFKPFIIEGNGAILDGSAPVPPEAWENYKGPVFRFRPPRMHYQQLFLNDRPAVRVFAKRESAEPPKLEPLEWCLFNGHIYFSVEPHALKLPKDYPLTYTNKRVGITLYHVDWVGILDLTVQGFQLDGINVFNNARRVTLAGVTCRGNGRSGITVGGASRSEIDACLLGNNGFAQLLTLPWSETQIRNTALLSNTAPGWVDQGGRVYLDGKRIEGGLEKHEPEFAARAREKVSAR